MFGPLKTIFKSSWTGFYRDGGLAVANIFILVLTISLITSLFLLKDVSRFLISKVEEKADISVYFKEDISEDEILRAKEEVSEVPEVKEVEYVSKEKVLEEFVKRHKEEPVLMEALEEVGRNPFLAALNIRASQAGHYELISKFFEKPEFKDSIEKIDYYKRKPLIESIFTFTANINKAGIILAIILVIISILITFNTIRLSIINFGQEISIQRLVGASNWFIRGPFIVQGMISGIFATLICLIIFSLSLWYFSPKIESSLMGLSLFNLFTTNFRTILLLQLATGISLGVISSLIAIRRYLRV